MPNVNAREVMSSVRKEPAPFTVVALKNNKVVDQYHTIHSASALPAHINFMIDENPGATIGVENKDGKIVYTINPTKNEALSTNDRKILFKVTTYPPPYTIEAIKNGKVIDKWDVVANSRDIPRYIGIMLTKNPKATMVVKDKEGVVAYTTGSTNEETLDETHGAGVGRYGPPNGGIPDLDLNDLHNMHSDPEALQRLNTFVMAIGERTYINPQTPLSRLKTKLRIVGMDFALHPILENVGSMSIPLSLWGGVFDPYIGKNVNLYTKLAEDGMNLALQVEWNRLKTGRWEVFAEVVKTDEEPQPNKNI